MKEAGHVTFTVVQFDLTIEYLAIVHPAYKSINNSAYGFFAFWHE